jgi:hypothetical protein
MSTITLLGEIREGDIVQDPAGGYHQVTRITRRGEIRYIYSAEKLIVKGPGRWTVRTVGNQENEPDGTRDGWEA